MIKVCVTFLDLKLLTRFLINSKNKQYVENFQNLRKKNITELSILLWLVYLYAGFLPCNIQHL